MNDRDRQSKSKPPRGGSSVHPVSSGPGRGRRKWLFRILALTLTPLLMLGLAEGVLRWTGYGSASGFFRQLTIDHQGFIVENDTFSRRFFPAHLARHPLPLRFPAEKPKGTIRIFVMGESAAMGDPDPAFGFSRILEILLQDRFPGARFEVINVAFTAINSHVILPIARDCARYEGDLWVVYMGHNEVPGPFGPGTVFGSSRSRLWMTRAIIALRATKIGQFLESVRSSMEGEQQAPRSWRGLEMFLKQQLRENDPRLTAMYAQYRQNLGDLLKAGRKSGAEIVLCLPACNLKDSAPFASLHAPEFSAAQQTAWDQAYKPAVAAQAAGEFPKAQTLFQSAAALDSQFAELPFRLGQCALAVQQPTQARSHFERARDLDTLRFRTDSRLGEIVREVGSHYRGQGVVLCDAPHDLAAGVGDRVPGDELFFDHVHLTFDGNYLLARAVAEQAAGRLSARLGQTGNRDWADAEACARQLGFTDWHQFQMVDVMRRRLLEAPFTNQLNHLDRQRRFLEKLTALRGVLQPEGLTEALRISRAAAARSADDPVVHENLARLLAAAGESKQAIMEFRRVAELWPHHPAAFNNLGVLLQKSGQAEEAERSFQQALALRPDYPDAWNSLGTLRAARGDWPQAIAAYRTALRANPDFADAQVNLGQALREQGKLAESAACFLAALKSRPGYWQANLALADLRLKEGKPFEAVPLLSDAARAQPDTILARSQLEVERQPSSPIVYFKLANVLAAVGKTAEGLENLRTAVRLDTNFWEARYLLGVEFASQERLAEAQDQFTTVLQRRPDYTRAHLNLGVTLAKQLRWQEAANQFRETLRLEPTNQLAQMYLQRVLFLTNAPPP